MQNTEGQERYRKWLKDKGKSTKHNKVQCDAQARAGIKRCSAKRLWVNGSKFKKAYLDKMLCKTAIISQQ